MYSIRSQYGFATSSTTTSHSIALTSQRTLGWQPAWCRFAQVALLVPTPNGAGSWHFAVKTILVLYGLEATEAVLFALVVHTVQTLLLVVLGIYGTVALQFTPKASRRMKPQALTD